jgi:hypothetical protein
MADNTELDKYAMKMWMPTDGDPKGRQVLIKAIPLNLAKSVFAAHDADIKKKLLEGEKTLCIDYGPQLGEMVQAVPTTRIENVYKDKEV